MQMKDTTRLDKEYIIALEREAKEKDKRIDDLQSACAEYQQEIFKLREQIRDLEYVTYED